MSVKFFLPKIIQCTISYRIDGTFSTAPLSPFIKVLTLGTALAFGIYFTNKASAANLEITNKTNNTSIGNCRINGKYLINANEGYDPDDGPFIDSPYENSLEIYSEAPGFKAKIDARPQNTPEIEAKLAVKGYIASADNSLRFKVLDATGLENRKIQAYNTTDPNIVYDINKQPKVTTEIELPYLVNQPEGVYATWVIKTPANVPGDCASELGVGTLDGKVDFWDIKVGADEWLQETYEGQNYLWSDVNHDRLTNFVDFAIQANDYNPE